VYNLNGLIQNKAQATQNEYSHSRYLPFNSIECEHLLKNNQNIHAISIEAFFEMLTFILVRYTVDGIWLID